MAVWLGDNNRYMASDSNRSASAMFAMIDRLAWAIAIAVGQAIIVALRWKETGSSLRTPQVSPALSRLFEKGPSSTPDRPWHLIISHDEVTPGALLRPDNRRKFSAFYCSFVELGAEALRWEVAWFPMAVLRSADDIVLTVALRLLLTWLAERLLPGIILPLQGGPTYLFARIAIHLADEAALKSGLSVKGASGIRPCLRCGNILKKHSDLSSRRPGLFEITETGTSRFVAVTDEELWRRYDQLEAMVGACTATELEQRERAAGLSVVHNSVLSDRNLRAHFRPIDSVCFDWMHCMVQNGVANVELHLLLKACREVGMTNVWSLLQKFVSADWKSCSYSRSKIKGCKDIFSPSRERASKDSFKAGASEFISVYPFVRRFVEQFLASEPRLTQQVQSFLLCCRVLDLLLFLKAGFSHCHTEELQIAVKRHQDEHKVVYGQAHWLPKHHFTTHIPAQIARWQVVLDLFVIERGHQLPKAQAEPVKNTLDFERSVLASTVTSRIVALPQFDERPKLTSAAAACSFLQSALGESVQVANKAFTGAFCVAAGDVLFILDSCIFVRCLIDGESSGLHALGHRCEALENIGHVGRG